jgi:hypothetical protein
MSVFLFFAKSDNTFGVLADFYGATTFSITTISTMTLSIITLGMNDIQHNDTWDE